MTTDIMIMVSAVAWALSAGIVALFILYRTKNELVKDATIAVIRAIVQLLALGLVLQLVFANDSLLVQLSAILVILVFSTIIATERSPLPRAHVIVFSVILSISAILLLPTFMLGIFEIKANATIPIAAMIIANVMHAAALTLESLHDEMKASWKELEAWLALGVKPSASSTALRRRVVKISILSTVNGLKAVGIVHIPGLMAGLLVSGTPPLMAAIFQFLLSTLIFAGGVFSSFFLSNLTLKRYFDGPYLKKEYLVTT